MSIYHNVAAKSHYICESKHLGSNSNQTIISCLPNAENNPSQAQLYEAVDSGNVSTVMQYERSERQQLFITSISINYADSLAKTDFSSLKKKRKRKAKPKLQTKMPFGMDPRMMMMMKGMGGPGGMGGGGLPGRTSSKKDKKDTKDKENDGDGFLVVIEGYSPYKNINELIDPLSPGDQSEWGFITRLVNLSKLENIAGSDQFELFEKDNSEHFKPETGEVILGDDDTPFGIGIEKSIERVPSKEKKTDKKIGGKNFNRLNYGGGGQDIMANEDVLVDPLTGEEISRTFNLVTQEDIDNNPDKWTERDLGRKKYDLSGEVDYIVRDHWFKISAKFLWKNSPEAQKQKKAPVRKRLPKKKTTK